MKIRINKLFGRYNTEVDLDKKCIIYIGENGVGKSTILKILNCLFKYDYIGLTKYYFESIDIIEKNIIIRVRYLDLTLKKDYVVKKFCEKSNINYKDYLVARNELEKKQKKEYNNKDYTVLVDSLNEWDLVAKFEYYFLQYLDYRLLHKIFKCNQNLLETEDIFIYNAESWYFCNWFEDIYKEAKISSKEGKYYLNSNIKNMHSSIKELLGVIEWKECLFIDMTLNWNIKNDMTRKCVKKRNLDWAMTKEYKDYLNNNNWMKIKPNEKYRLNDKKIIEKLKKTYRINYNEAINNNYLDIGQYLFNNVYTEELINSFTNDFYDYLYNNYNGCINQGVELIYNDMEIDNYLEFMNEIKYYLDPLIDLIFENTSGSQYYNKGEFELFMGFYNKYKNKYFNIKNKKLKILNKLFNKYFKNKKVVATPFGIVISTSGLKNDINFEELSMGEKKIILLFTFSIFSEDMIILLDEPEASLSIIWQQELLLDIIDNTKFKRLIVATQSPYICESEKLDNYIIPLISGDDYE